MCDHFDSAIIIPRIYVTHIYVSLCMILYDYNNAEIIILSFSKNNILYYLFLIVLLITF